jgi:hypothetical protein
VNTCKPNQSPKPGNTWRNPQKGLCRNGSIYNKTVKTLREYIDVPFPLQTKPNLKIQEYMAQPPRWAASHLKINKVGTYGMAPAQLYWGRMAALLLRLTYMIFFQVDWGFVFVDDFCWILRADTANLWAATMLASYLALGVPLSWKKTVLSEINTWLGFVVNPKSLVVRMAEDKHDIIMAILNSRREKALPPRPLKKHLEESVGQQVYALFQDPFSNHFGHGKWHVRLRGDLRS